MHNDSITKIIVRRIMAVLLVAWIPCVAIGAVNHAVTVVDGSSLNVVFTAPNTPFWTWRLVVNAGDGWKHIPDSQRPDTAPWVPQEFSAKSGYWSVPVTPDSPERAFQICFAGELEPDAFEGASDGEPVIGTWAVEGEAETSDYYILPEWTNVRAEKTVLLSAVDGAGGQAGLVASAWTIAPNVDVIPSTLPNGGTVLFNPCLPGAYTVSGHSLQPPALSDTAFINAIRVRMAESNVTAFAGAGIITLSLASSSFLGVNGDADWTSGTNGTTIGSGMSIQIDPAGWGAGVYTITARSTLLPGECYDTCELRIVTATIELPPIIGVNDLVSANDDPANSVKTPKEFDKDDDLKPVGWSVAPPNIGGGVSFTAVSLVKIGRNTGTEILWNPSFPVDDTNVILKIEGIKYSSKTNDAIVTMSVESIPCTVAASTTVVQVKLDKFCYNRVNPMPQVDIWSVTDLVPGRRAIALYKVAGDILSPSPSAFQTTFPVADRLGTYEFKTQPFVNRLGNNGWGTLRYTVYDRDGTRAARWCKGEPSASAITTVPIDASMKITIFDALAEKPQDALDHLLPLPAFAGSVKIVGGRPKFEIGNIQIYPKAPSSPYTNEIAAALGEEQILQTLHGIAKASASIMEISGPLVVGVNDRFGDADPGDKAQIDRCPDDPDFIELQLVGLPRCLQKGTVTWTASGRINLVSPDPTQVGPEIRHAFVGGSPNDDMLRVYVEGLQSSDSIDAAEVKCMVQLDGGLESENPRAYWGQILKATFRLTVADARWTGFQADDQSGNPGEREDLLVCDLELRPAVRIDGPIVGTTVEFGKPLAVNGSIRSMLDIVRYVTVNGETVPQSKIYFLGKPVAGLSEASARELTDRPPPYVVTFEHEITTLADDHVRVQAFGGGGPWPGVAQRMIAFTNQPPKVGTLGRDLPSDPVFDLPAMVTFFDGEGDWPFLFKTAVNHCGAGRGVVSCYETCGAQPSAGLFLLRQPVVFLDSYGGQQSIPAPGLFIRNANDGGNTLVAEYHVGKPVCIRKLFPVNLQVEDAGGCLPDALEWSPGAVLAVGKTQGVLRVVSPFGTKDMPADAVLTLTARSEGGAPNPFTDFNKRDWTASTLQGVETISLNATLSGEAAFEAELSSKKYGIIGKDRVKVRGAVVDVRVDSLNALGYGEPVSTPEVEAIEDDPEQPGKIIMVNANDGDGDGVPDWADGFNLLPDNPAYLVCTGADFVPIVFSIPKPLDIATARVHLDYSASDPRLVTTNEAGRYIMPPGNLRLWSENGDAARKANPVWDGSPGHYLPPTPAEGISASLLGFTEAEREKTFYMEGIRPSAAAGDQRIAFSVAPDINVRGPAGPHLEDAARLTLIKVDLIPDWNHDRKIDDNDKDQATITNPFRFWINDDDDAGDISEGDSDLPGQTGGRFGNANYGNSHVDGRSDLLDFFPVWLDLKQILDLLPPSDTVQYKLRQAESAVNAVYTDLTKGRAGAFLTTEGKTYGPLLKQNTYEADTFEVTSSGVTLSTNFLNKIKNDGTKGILMIEGAAQTTSPLVLEVWKDGAIICASEMPASFDGVDRMYRTVNLRNMTNPGTLPPPKNNPDTLSNGKNMVFLHGYQPVREAGPGVQNWHKAWLAEMFKRFYWSGSQAKFHGIAWRSDGGDKMDYQKNVTNAFCTAPVLKDYVMGLNGDVVVAAHSLGNMVVSSAIVDYNMRVSKYMLCDAAVASEAYDITIAETSLLVNNWWADYDSKTWAAKWYARFQGTGDSRANLTWRNRFKKIITSTEAWNFYSSGDEIFSLAENPGLLSGVFYVKWWFIIPISHNVNFGRYSWQKQELFKGTEYNQVLFGLGSTGYAGWGFNSTLVGPNSERQYQVQPVYTVAQANTATDVQLRTTPVFQSSPSWLVGVNALPQMKINEMLGMGIPALTPSTGTVYISPFGGQHQSDLNSPPGDSAGYKPNGWPDRGRPDYQNWLHNDIKDVTYLFTYKLFDKIVGAGGLK